MLLWSLKLYKSNDNSIVMIFVPSDFDVYDVQCISDNDLNFKFRLLVCSSFLSWDFPLELGTSFFAHSIIRIKFAFECAHRVEHIDEQSHQIFSCRGGGGRFECQSAIDLFSFQ